MAGSEEKKIPLLPRGKDSWITTWNVAKYCVLFYNPLKSLKAKQVLILEKNPWSRALHPYLTLLKLLKFICFGPPVFFPRHLSIPWHFIEGRSSEIKVPSEKVSFRISHIVSHSWRRMKYFYLDTQWKKILSKLKG